MESTKQKSYALPIAMMFALFFMIAFVTGLQNPMGIIVKEQFQVPNWMSQLGLRQLHRLRLHGYSGGYHAATHRL
jgi:fucose permease